MTSVAPTSPPSVLDDPTLLSILREVTARGESSIVTDMVAASPPNDAVIITTPAPEGTSPRHIPDQQGDDVKSATLGTLDVKVARL